MGQMVVVAYKPKEGKEEELHRLVREHVPRLRRLGLATDRPVVAMRAADGSVVEVFEWVSKEAVDGAHSNPEVLAIWGEFAAACDYVPVGSLPEAGQLFSPFTPLEL